MFSDGAELEIFGFSVGKRVLEDPKARVWFAKFGVFSSFIPKGGSSYVLGDFNVDIREEFHKPVRWEASFNGADSLLLEFRVSENGKGLSFPDYLIENHGVFQDRRLKIGGSNYRNFRYVSESLEEIKESMKGAGLELMLQYQDPGVGWISCNGSYIFNEAWKDRYMAALPVWMRNEETLHFRAIRASGAVAEFSIPNPDWVKTPRAMTVDALPWTHTGPDYTLTVMDVHRVADRGRHPLAEVSYTLVPAVPNATRSLIRLEYGNAVEDEWGNRIKMAGNGSGRTPTMRANVPVGSRKLKLPLHVQRDVNYPQPSRAGYAILEGVVSADGSNVKFKPLATSLMLTASATVSGPISAPYNTARNVRKKLEFEIKANTRQIDMLEKKIGEFGKCLALVVPEGSAQTVGELDSLGGSWGEYGKTADISRKLGWVVPENFLKPGAKFTVSLFAPLPEDQLDLTVELPEQILTRPPK
ncbi:MAG: hypothetical protein QM680_08990 [Luteolibacter sp.]